jgi:PAS domain S-box-containing protein
MGDWLPSGEVAIASLVLLILLTIGLGSAAVVRGVHRRSGRRASRRGDAGGYAEPFLRAVGETITTLKEKQDTLSHLREHAEQRAQEAETYSSLVLKAIPTGVVGFDDSLQVESINPAAGTLLGMAPQAALGKRCAELLSDDGGLGDALGSCLRGAARRRPVEFRVRRLDGRPLIVEGRIACLGGERRHGVLAVLTDMTDARALERRVRLKESLASAGEMAAGLSHQVGNSLAALAGYGRLLKTKQDTPAEVERLADRVQAEVRELEQVTRDFLKFARPEELNPEPADVVALVEEVLRSFRDDLSANAIHLQRRFEHEAIQASVDGVLLKEALANLVRNAVEAMPSGGELTVEVAAAQEGHDVAITISDTGEGLAGKNIQELLRPFYTTKERGTGLGLSVVEKVAALHGGSLTCSDGAVRGAVFSLALPAGNQEAA